MPLVRRGMPLVKRGMPRVNSGLGERSGSPRTRGAAGRGIALRKLVLRYSPPERASRTQPIRRNARALAIGGMRVSA